MSFEDGFPQLYHYRILTMGVGGSGMDKFRKFEKAVKEDQILDFLKRNLKVCNIHYYYHYYSI